MRENINFMWLSNKHVADHNTIARFRSKKLKNVFKDIFKQVVLLLAQEGLITLKQVYKARYNENNFAANQEKYEQQEKLFGQRNSYSKTDNDATFMRIKEDHMKNGQLKPSYNVQISSEDQFIVNYTLHQDINEIHTFKPHLESYEYLYQDVPESLTADAGCGS